jgi:hypothetical protein
MFVKFNQAIEDQAVYSLGRSVCPNARIQIRWHRFDQEINDPGLGRNTARAGGKGNDEEQGSKGN